MRICFIKDLILVDGTGKEYIFRRMRRYKMPQRHAKELIEQGYCFEYGFMNELGVAQ